MKEGFLGQFHREVFLVWQDAKSTGEKEVGEMPVKDTSSWDNGETELT